MKILKDYWLAFAVIVVLIGLGAWVCTRPQPAPPMPPTVEHAIEAGIAHDQARAATDTAVAQRAAATAPANYAAGKAYAGLAAILHQQNKPHAKPTPGSDTAAERLQRQLSGY